MTVDEAEVSRELRLAEDFARAGQPHAALVRLRALERRLRGAAGGAEPTPDAVLARVRRAMSAYRRQLESQETSVRGREERYRAREREAAKSPRPTDRGDRS